MIDHRPLLTRLPLLRQFATKADLNNLFSQLSALSEIKELIGPNLAMGPLRGWAISPDALLIVLRDIIVRNKPRVIEFGAGESTLAISAMLRAMGGGSLISIEHDADFAATIQARISHTHLDGYSKLIVAPIRDYDPPHGHARYRSYDLARLNNDFDVALIDGPISSSFGALSRLIPLRWCIDRLPEGSSVYLDDSARIGEKTALHLALQLSRTTTLTNYPTEKGLTKIVRNP